jgi:UDP-glucose 4-epimerase
MHILVTGGAGYIGSHTIVELLAAGHTVHVVDNLSNSSAKAIERVQEISGASVPLDVFDLQDKPKLDTLFSNHQFDAVMHFAGLKAVGESTKKPLLYYRTNLDASMTLLEVMSSHDVHKLIFSSTATVYGSAPYPYKETQAVGQGITNPYAQTKYMIEEMMRDLAATNPENQFTTLRYFNPIGAHPSGKIGEDPHDIPNNLMPYIAQVAVGRREKLNIFGNDYDTVDGTGVRDYIHVIDLAKGHVAALEHLKPGMNAINLGSGHGTSVFELLHAFEKAAGKTIPYEIVSRRSGDLPEFYADASKALQELGWKTEQSVEAACSDTWRWQSNNPQGYGNS